MDVDTEDLLKAWGLEEFIKNFIDERIDISALSVITDDLAKELIKPIGPRAKFLANLKEWRNVLQVASGHGLTEDTLLQSDSSTSSQSFIIDVEDLSNSRCEQSTFKNDQCLQSPEILELLKSCNDGKALLQLKALDNFSRSKLCDLIINYELKNDPNVKLSSSRLMNLADQIVHIFKNEHKSTYFIPYINFNCQKKAAKGKLLNSFHKYRKKYRKLGLIASRRNSAHPLPSSSACNNNINWNTVWNVRERQEPTEEVKNKLLWLNNSTTPLETVKAYWKETAEYRLSTLISSNKSISEYIGEYPAVKKPTGYVLLMDDFEFMYPNSVHLSSEFPLYKNKIFEQAKQKISHLKDPNIKALLDKLEHNHSDHEEFSNYIAFCMLPYLLSPLTINKKGKDCDSSKKTWRPSRSEMKDGFITEVAGVGDLTKTVSDRKEKLARFGHHLQPFIICIPHEGVTNTISDYYVIIEDFMYMFNNVLSAVDCCFKCTQALNAQYPVECSSLWFVIQKGFYKIQTPWDKQYVGINTLLSELGITVTD